MSVDLFFPVPLLVQDVAPEIRDAIQTKVSAYLATEQAQRTINPSPEESVATSFYRKEASILVDAGLDELEEVIMSAARGFIEDTLQLPPRRFEIEQAWINLFEPGAQEGQHSHDGSLLSCSYYVEAPKDCGCIVLPDPIGARRSYREFTKTAGSNLLTRREIAIEPQPGRLVMFESWTPHYIQCNKSDRVRISIAINLREAKSDAPARPRSVVEPQVSNTVEAAPAQHVPAPPANAASAEKPAAATARPRPFLFNELFEVRTDVKIQLNAIQDAIPTVVIDDVLKRPDRVRELVGSAPAANWKLEEGSRNFVDYYDCRLRFPIRPPNGLIGLAYEVIKRVSGVETKPTHPSVDVNWFMQIKEKRADFAAPHTDITETDDRSFTCIVYLNSPEECSGGTTFLRFKESGALIPDEAYGRAMTYDPRVPETGLDYWPAAAEELWERVGEIEMQTGRMLIFPSEFFHAAYHPEDWFFDFPRLTLAFWMVN